MEKKYFTINVYSQYQFEAIADMVEKLNDYSNIGFTYLTGLRGFNLYMNPNEHMVFNLHRHLINEGIITQGYLTDKTNEYQKSPFNEKMTYHNLLEGVTLTITHLRYVHSEEDEALFQVFIKTSEKYKTIAKFRTTDVEIYNMGVEKGWLESCLWTLPSTSKKFLKKHCEYTEAEFTLENLQNILNLN